ncbi:MAG: type B 50S ribosomal protein L31 [Gemmatimonadetes bacterium]|jgi:large subunit ribosomal protein L31|nr:type B 50S ribosomal protein L31 [Gemmatimonadota bacterium]MBT6147022.1 type B 50S ribosomal protein L31 [Gemmatimonadota bacterium]MBT7861825.1 type B 50S ribosomal protein L31 [Gemmatimonadota bacterium]
MRKDIHPDYRQVVFLDVSSDFKVLTRSTVQASETVEWEDGKEYPVVRFDLSSASHAFYTGKEQQLNDRGGRIQQFRDRYGKQDEASDATAEEAATAEPATAEAETAETADS